MNETMTTGKAELYCIMPSSRHLILFVLRAIDAVVKEEDQGGSAEAQAHLIGNICSEEYPPEERQGNPQDQDHQSPISFGDATKS